MLDDIAKGEARGARGATESFLFPFEGLASRLHALVFIRFRFASLAIAVAIYAAVLLAFGKALAVSGNYFVILPVIFAALGFGAIGGFVSGTLALPTNLLIFGILGHPEFSPASKLIAELSGIVVGFTSGRLADYFRDVEREIKKRMATEGALRSALADKELLLHELHHRVKNNLNVIKSLVKLQRNRSTEASFLEAADELIGRIFAISLVHDQLDMVQDPSAVDPAKYIESLVGNLASAFGLESSRIGLSLQAGGPRLSVEETISLGLIVNEVLTNALKHASRAGNARGAEPSIRLSLSLQGERYSLTICDDGPGPDSRGEAKSGLGLKLVSSLARSLGGESSLGTIDGVEGPAGARFELSFPSRGRGLYEYLR